MKTARATFTSAIISILALSLLTSVTLAAELPIGDYAQSSSGLFPEVGILKNQGDCPEGTTFIKNAFPALTNGQGGSVIPVEETYFLDLDGVATPVTVRVFWTELNSVGFEIDSGVAHIVSVTSDANTLLYDYVDYYPDGIATGSPIISDSDLNKLKIASAADDVNHLDLCLAAAAPPSITILSPLDTDPPTLVSGEEIVTATVTDDIEVDESTVMASIVGDTLLQLGVGTPTVNPDEFTWSWNTTTIDPDANGNYTVTVSATDTTGITATRSVTVAADTEPPSLSIVAPINGVSASGLVTVKANASDNVTLVSVTARVLDSSNVEVKDLGEGTPSLDPDHFEWTWDTTTTTPTYTDGEYTIEATATDESGNSTTTSIVFELANSLQSCEGFLGDEDGSLNQTEGCFFTPVQNVQIPPQNKGDAACKTNNNGETCTITEFLLIPDPAAKAPHLAGICSGEFVYADPRVDANGLPQDVRTLNVFAELGGAPDGFTGQLILDEFTYGNPCFFVVAGKKNFDLTDAFFWPADDPATPEDEATGLVFIRTNFAEVLSPGIGPIPQCYGIAGTLDLQEAGQIAYQTDDLGRMRAGAAEVMTNRCFNPKRMSSFDFSFSVGNIKEHGLILTGPDDILTFKVERADIKFDFLEQALFAAEPQLISPRFSVLTRKFNQARSQFDKRNSSALARAIADLEDLLFEVKNGTWDVNDLNYPGEVQMRTENLIWRIKLLKAEVERLEAL
jgi:hypothetical protein